MTDFLDLSLLILTIILKYEIIYKFQFYLFTIIYYKQGIENSILVTKNYIYCLARNIIVTNFLIFPDLIKIY